MIGECRWCSLFSVFINKDITLSVWELWGKKKQMH